MKETWGKTHGVSQRSCSQCASTTSRLVRRTLRQRELHLETERRGTMFRDGCRSSQVKFHRDWVFHPSRAFCKMDLCSDCGPVSHGLQLVVQKFNMISKTPNPSRGPHGYRERLCMRSCVRTPSTSCLDAKSVIDLVAYLAVCQTLVPPNRNAVTPVAIRIVYSQRPEPIGSEGA